VITNFAKISPDNTLYIRASANQALGFLKLGRKNLFHRDAMGNITEFQPFCVLDFYVHESC